ncbi:uncharacterized protein BP01DRAFT_407051 [Aspergillus saccharolyticus JOP 1030-1]|uniref:F-box domain-containing protein n=1 Tax=Aspergillus saccharolyticus JOP 1030-1 TaxID=1450539 RepID=A0A318Z592_9EURO|nr:hypothetical protein BP01DRAFT_407051 [Aspergillus saccharolyticus JOP 1030-1]PYH41527.1 hypothetical protein BP01DRAFT_407051 [Aspergillus saccharolyticus JOP 1030-1]
MPGLLGLPPELMHMIVEKLDFASDLYSLALVCKGLRANFAEEYLYGKMFGKLLSHKLDLQRLFDNFSISEDFTRYLIKSCKPELLLASARIRQQVLEVAIHQTRRSEDVDTAMDSYAGKFLKLWLAYAREHPQEERSRLRNLMARAVYANSLPFVQYLMSQGFTDDENCSSPLYWAADGGSLELVKMLLDAGADPNRQYAFIHPPDPFLPHENPPLLPVRRAAVPGCEEIVWYLLQNGAAFSTKLIRDLIQSESIGVESAIQDASSKDLSDLIIYGVATNDPKLVLGLWPLVNHDIDYDYGTGDWISEALEKAAERQNLSMVRLLLTKVKETDPSQLVSAGFDTARSAIKAEWTPGLVAAVDPDLGGDELLRTDGPGLLSLTISKKLKDMREMLLSRWALLRNTDSILYHYPCPLRTALYIGDSAIFFQMLEYVYLSPAEDGSFPNPIKLLKFPAQYGPVETFRETLAHVGVELDPDNEQHGEVLVEAARGVQTDIMQLFLDARFDMNGVYRSDLDENFKLPLLHCVLLTHISPVREHSGGEKAIRLDGSSTRGLTALATVMSRFRHYDPETLWLIRVLLAHGADPLAGIEDAPGQSALQVALTETPGRVGCIKALLRAVSWDDHRCRALVSMIATCPDAWLKTPLNTIPEEEAQWYWSNLCRGLEDNPYEPEDDSDESTDEDDSEGRIRNNSHYNRFECLKIIRKYYWRNLYPPPTL